MEIHSRAQAIALGLKRYFTGKPCKHGHLVARFMVGGCVECHRIMKNTTRRRKRRRPDQVEARLRAKAARRDIAAVARAQEIERREALRAAQKLLATAERAARSIELKAAADERRRQRYLGNREACLARSKAHYHATKEATRDRRREQMREYRRNNPEKFRARKRKRKAAKRAGVVDGLMRLQRGRCAYCRAKLVPAITHIDHVTPLALGGADHRTNLQLACATCNIVKSDKDPIIFAQQIGRLL